MGNVCFSRFIKRYLRLVGPGRSRATTQTDGYLLAACLRTIGNKRLLEITQEDILSHRCVRLGQDGVTPCTVNHEVAALHCMLGKAVEWGYLKTNPAHGLRRVPWHRPDITGLTPEQVNRLLLVATLEPAVKVAILGFIYTGLRRGELVNLRWQDVDLGDNVIRVCEGKSGRGPSGGKTRTIPIGAALRQQINGESAPPQGPVFRDERGKRWRGDWLYRRIRKLGKKAGIKGLTCHRLRHTFCTRLLQCGADLRTVQHLAGHSSIKTTERYLHTGSEQLRAAVGKLKY